MELARIVASFVRTDESAAETDMDGVTHEAYLHILAGMARSHRVSGASETHVHNACKADMTTHTFPRQLLQETRALFEPRNGLGYQLRAEDHSREAAERNSRRVRQASSQRPDTGLFTLLHPARESPIPSFTQWSECRVWNLLHLASQRDIREQLVVHDHLLIRILSLASLDPL